MTHNIVSFVISILSYLKDTFCLKLKFRFLSDKENMVFVDCPIFDKNIKN